MKKTKEPYYRNESELYNFDELIQNELDEIQSEWLDWANDYDSEEEEND